MDAIEQFKQQGLAWNGKPIRSTDEEITRILGPMFTQFPNTGADGGTVRVYVQMLRDVDPETLSAAVLNAMNTCKFLPTVAEIREQIPKRAAGPHSEVDPTTLPRPRMKMYRPDEDEDRAQRLAQLRRFGGR